MLDFFSIQPKALLNSSYAYQKLKVTHYPRKLMMEKIKINWKQLECPAIDLIITIFEVPNNTQKNKNWVLLF